MAWRFVQRAQATGNSTTASVTMASNLGGYPGILVGLVTSTTATTPALPDAFCTSTSTGGDASTIAILHFTRRINPGETTTVWSSTVASGPWAMTVCEYIHDPPELLQPAAAMSASGFTLNSGTAVTSVVNNHLLKGTDFLIVGFVACKTASASFSAPAFGGFSTGVTMRSNTNAAVTANVGLWDLSFNSKQSPMSQDATTNGLAAQCTASTSISGYAAVIAYASTSALLPNLQRLRPHVFSPGVPR